MSWNVVMNTTSSFTLACIPPNSFITGEIFVNPLDTNILFGILDQGDDYSLVSMNLQGKNCTVVGVIPGLPPNPKIIIAAQIGSITGNIAISVTSDQYNAVVIYDQKLKLVSQVKTNAVIEDLFVQETNN